VCSAKSYAKMLRVLNRAVAGPGLEGGSVGRWAAEAQVVPALHWAVEVRVVPALRWAVEVRVEAERQMPAVGRKQCERGQVLVAAS
jgi:hypothetical protein